MKNLLKLTLVAFAASATMIACGPPKSKTEEITKDSLTTAPDTAKSDSVTIKRDTLQIDTVKK